MTLALSTNWCNGRLDSGEAIVDAALEVGAEALELGFRTSFAQVKGFKARLDEMPVGSVHAFCPVPLSAPSGHPELYTLATDDPDARALGRAHLLKTLRFASEMGADTVVHHAGRVSLASFFDRSFDSSVLRRILIESDKDVGTAKYRSKLASAWARREKRGAKMLSVFRRELASVLAEAEKLGVVLALENLPYLEGFPDEREMAQLMSEFAGAPLAPWFDTGHDRVRVCHGWIGETDGRLAGCRGMHLNDVTDLLDDHFAPGDGCVEFEALVPMMRAVRHVVIEPNAHVSAERLAAGFSFVRGLLDRT